LVENKENLIEPRPGPEKKRKELDVTNWTETERKKSKKDIKKKSEHLVADEGTSSCSWSTWPLQQKKKVKKGQRAWKKLKNVEDQNLKLVMFQY
jgi:hypothetical protein